MSGLCFDSLPPFSFFFRCVQPTTGLDARSALLVVKLLRKIADQGRTICATIHQPSSAVFELFVSVHVLLLCVCVGVC